MRATNLTDTKLTLCVAFLVLLVLMVMGIRQSSLVTPALAQTEPGTNQSMNGVTIECIQYSGEEFVMLRNQSTAPITVSSWQLTDISDNGPTFTFPEFTLLPGTTITVYTAPIPSRAVATNPTQNTVFSFNRGSSIWADGDPDTAALVDSNGTTISTKTYPPGCATENPDLPSTPDSPPVTASTSYTGLQIACIAANGVRPGESDEYVRIINTGTGAIDLGAVTLKDVDDGTPTFEFPAYMLWPKQEIRVYTNQIHYRWGGFSFGKTSSIWNNSSDTPDAAALFAPTGEMLSFRSYPDTCHSLARSNTLTQAALFHSEIPKPEPANLVIECIAFRRPEYVELQNRDSVAVQLQYWRLRDIADGTPTFIFPEYLLEPGELVRVYTSPPEQPQPNHFTFGRRSSVWADRNPDVAGLFSPFELNTPVSTKTYPPGC